MASMIENVQTTVEGVKMTKPTSDSSTSKPNMMAGYLAFACVCFTVGEHYSERDFSTLLTLANGFHMLGMILLRVRMELMQTAAGVSAKSIMLTSLACIFRLSSTTWLAGYIPTDATGNWVYQAADIVTFLTSLTVLHALFRRFASTRDPEMDDRSPKILNLFMVCVLFANISHGDLNDNPVFDIFWFIGFYVDCVSHIPQLVMLWYSPRGTEHVISAHYVWPFAMRVFLSFSFFFYAFPELVPEDCKDCVNYVGYSLISMHSIQFAVAVLLGALKVDKHLPKPDAEFRAKMGVSEGTELFSLQTDSFQPKDVSVMRNSKVQDLDDHAEVKIDV